MNLYILSMKWTLWWERQLFPKALTHSTFQSFDKKIMTKLINYHFYSFYTFNAICSQEIHINVNIMYVMYILHWVYKKKSYIHVYMHGWSLMSFLKGHLKEIAYYIIFKCGQARFKEWNKNERQAPVKSEEMKHQNPIFPFFLHSHVVVCISPMVINIKSWNDF